MQQRYTIKSIHLHKLQEIKRDILAKQDRQAKARRAETLRRAEENEFNWELVRAGCNPRGNTTRAR